MCNFKRANVFQLSIDDSRAQGCNFQFADFMEWNILYKMRQRIVNRLNILRGSDFYE